MIDEISKNYLLHKKVIKADISHEKADWAAGNYWKAGADMADIVTLALGPMSEYEGLANFEGDAGFAAGFLYGMVGDNHLEEI